MITGVVVDHYQQWSGRQAKEGKTHKGTRKRLQISLGKPVTTSVKSLVADYGARMVER